MLPIKHTGAYWLGFCLALIAISSFIAHLISQKHSVADFLISVQGEVDKVTWPSFPEVKRATVVVLFLIVSMALVMIVFDVAWQWVFRSIGFLEIYRR